VVLSSAQARQLTKPAFSSKPRQMASNLSLMVFYDSRDSFCNVALERIEDIRQTSRHVRKVPSFKPGEQANARTGDPMSQEHPMMVGAAAVFVASNITESIEHYRDALGFTITFQYGTQLTMHACAVTK